MNNLDEEINRLLSKYQNGECNPQEIQRLYHIYNLAAKAEVDSQSEAELQGIGQEIWGKIGTSTGHQLKPNTFRSFNRPLFRWAAVLCIVSIIGLITFKKKSSDTNISWIQKHIDIAPGRNSATLTLSNGKKILLSASTDNNITEQNGVRILKEKSGQLVYQVTKNSGSTKSGFNTLTTTFGEQYKVQLPDGTLVWLNAGSSLTYPTIFNNSVARSVTLTGEAYFEVSTNRDNNGRKNPFTVFTNSESVKVLGTHFNINSYTDEAQVKTTLLEGSIELTPTAKNARPILLKPGQESFLTLSDNQLIVKTLDDPESEIAWQQGLFHFNHTEIKDVMRQLARWYNVEVIYKDEVPNAYFTGEMYRNLSASKVLEGLNYTGLHFSVNKHQIIVTN